MANDPAYLMYYKDILVSCADWDADVLGWYTRLISHQADKPEGLPNDLESLAVLAGVKFSQFDRFSQCWQRTLSAEFTATAKGLLVNVVQDGHLSRRRNHKNTQALRGLVGSYTKKLRLLNKYSPHQVRLVVAQLFEVISPDNSKEENEDAYKRTLIAYEDSIVGIVNGNANTKGCYTPDQETEIPAAALEAAEINQFTRTGAKNTEFVKGNWRVFLLERANDNEEMKLTFRTIEDFTRYFLNWIRTKHPTDGTSKTGTGPTRKPGTSEARTATAGKW